MKQNWSSYLLVAIICIAGTIFIMSHTNSRNEDYNIEYRNEELLQSIDSLNSYILKLQHEKDSLNSIIDTIESKKIVIYEKYKEDYINVTNQSISSDIKFFTNYLSKTNK